MAKKNSQNPEIVSGQALIIGASSDMAQAMSRLLASEGWNLVLAGRNTRDLRDQCSDLSIRYSIRAELLTIDLMDSNLRKKLASLDGIPELAICFAGIMLNEDDARSDADVAD
ncbi:MAG: hypothetical protein KDK33_16860, partial [Leptospiraceae bacterium]|nr:hypothetical protein [Leptospiraceae bacterium]